MKYVNKNRKNKNRKKLYIVAVISYILIASAASAGYFILKDRANKTVETDAKTTSEAPSAQENFSEGGEREPGNGVFENKGSGRVEDLNGQENKATDPSTWTTSKSKEITVHSPSANSIISKGTIVSGTSSISVVNYRLIDSLSGVIAQGEISTVNGVFSGKLSFDTGATEGRLDIYGIRSDGQEYSNIEIPIRFR